MGIKVYYWTHTSANWGHISMSLSDGTHISWWPNRPIDQHKKLGGTFGTAIAALTEWVDIIPDMTLKKDSDYEEHGPDEVIELPDGALDEKAIKTWWNKFKKENKYNGLRLNCSTVVWYALMKGGALKYLNDPKRWWWDPPQLLKAVKALKEGIKEKHKVQAQLDAVPKDIEDKKPIADKGGSIHDEL